MTPGPAPGVVAALRELIDAVDRRVPQLERACEPRIAKVAATLRVEAASRLDEMTRLDVSRDEQDSALVDAVMTDDGAPARTRAWGRD
jgi:hypothetical protein